MRIVGLDLSLTATGIAAETTAVATFPKRKGMDRLATLRTVILDIVDPGDLPRAGLVIIEGYSFNSKQGGEHLGELGGVIRLALWEAGVPVVEVAPAALKKFATGKGNAPKDAVLAAAVRAGFDGSNNNAADAYWLRQIGLYHLGLAEVPTTAYRTAAVEVLAWPQIEGAAA